MQEKTESSSYASCTRVPNLVGQRQQGQAGLLCSLKLLEDLLLHIFYLSVSPREASGLKESKCNSPPARGGTYSYMKTRTSSRYKRAPIWHPHAPKAAQLGHKCFARDSYAVWILHPAASPTLVSRTNHLRPTNSTWTKRDLCQRRICLTRCLGRERMKGQNKFCHNQISRY